MGVGLAGVPAPRDLRLLGEAAGALTRPLDAAGREAVYGGTAARFYRIDPARAGKGEGS